MNSPILEIDKDLQKVDVNNSNDIVVVEKTTNNALIVSDTNISLIDNTVHEIIEVNKQPDVLINTQTNREVVEVAPAAITVSGNMLKSVYDPQSVEDDAFDMDNMTDGVNKVAMTASERSAISQNTSDITDLENNKADKTNVLEKDNITEYTPSQNYHPATKKYVDDNSGLESAISSSLTYTNGKISEATVGSKTYEFTLGYNGRWTSVTDGTNTWNFTRNDKNQITGISVA